ncbi:MAG: hypothetical protein AAGI48_02280 [Verrucomicrobiota bacterium]
MDVAITQADGFAISMIAILALSFGFILMILVVMLRNGNRRNAEVDKLIDEVDPEREEQPAGDRGGEEKTKEPWEKSADWWQKED